MIAGGTAQTPPPPPSPSTTAKDETASTSSSDDGGGGCDATTLDYVINDADGSCMCKLCGEVVESRTHWYRHKYKVSIKQPLGVMDIASWYGPCRRCNKL
jgi:hypothetical protein